MELKVQSEKVLAAANKCETAKNILKEIFPEIFETIKYSETKVYAFKGARDIFILHKVNNDDFAWISLNSNRCYASGTYSSPENALKYDPKRIKEFNTKEEFLKWALEE
jgi:hypothetical protein